MTITDSYKRLLKVSEECQARISRPADLSRYLTSNGLAITTTQLGNWKSRGVPTKYLTKLATIFGVREAWLAHGTGEMHTMESDHHQTTESGSVALNKTAVTIDLDAECLAVWSQLQKLPEREREIWKAKLSMAAAQATLAKLEGETLPKDKQAA